MTSKLADRARQRAATRTGQTATVLVRDANGNLITGTPVGMGGGQCGPVQATQPQSWGAACPPGMCTSDNLAAALNRAFAGERYPCRELTYWVTLDPGAGTTATFSGNSLVTICPTRIAALVLDSTFSPNPTGFLTTFTIGSQNQIAGDPLPLLALNPESYTVIPFVTDCLKAGMPFTLTVDGVLADGLVLIGLIGPAIG